MLSDHHIEHRRIFQDSQHNARILYPPAIIRKADGARFGHESHLCKLNALEPFRHSSHRIHVSFSGLSGFSMDIFNVGFVFHHGIGVRHTHDRSKSRRDRRQRAAGDRFLFFVARLAKVNVHIDQARRHQLIGSINRFVILRLKPRIIGHIPNLLNPVVNDKHVTYPVDPVCRIDNSPIFYQEY